MKKEKKAPEPFWNAQVKIFFDFYEERFQTLPEFEGTPAPRALKGIIESLKKRALRSGINWTEEVACQRLFLFLSNAYQHEFLKKCFVLDVINRNKDLVFQKIANNGTSRVQANQNSASDIGKPGRKFSAI